MDSERDDNYYASQSEDEKEPADLREGVPISRLFVLTETVFTIITLRPNNKTSFRPSSVQTVEASTTM